MEHSALSEPLFSFLVALCIYFCARALDAGPLPWAYLAGLTAASAACVRAIGLLLPGVVVIALVVGARGTARPRLTMGVAAAASAILVLGVYGLAMRDATGYGGMSVTRTGGWAMYSRVAPFADCDRFTPPPDTRQLCEDRPASARPDGPSTTRPPSRPRSERSATRAPAIPEPTRRCGPSRVPRSSISRSPI